MVRIKLVACWLMLVSFSAVQAQELFFYGQTQNDLYKLLIKEGYKVRHFDDPEKAVRAAGKNDPVFLVAKNYPDRDPQMHISADLLKAIKRKKLRAYIEYPSAYEGLDIQGPPVETRLERGVATTDGFAPVLPRMGLLGLHNSYVLPVETPDPLIVLAKVVGYDKAEYGLTDTKVYPALFEKDGILISTTGLTNFQKGRYGPVRSVKAVWEYILSDRLGGPAVRLSDWPQDVKPAFPKEGALPNDARLESIKKGAEWYKKGNFFLHASWKDNWLKYQGDGTMPVGPPLSPNLVQGDGSMGILEGHTSTINYDGSQQYRYWMRADVQGEASMALAAAGQLLGNQEFKNKSANLLDFVFRTSNLRAGEKNNPTSPSYGMIGWATTHPGSFYADDNARTLLGAIAASSYLETDKWDKQIAEGILANFRLTGKKGFQGERLEEVAILQEGWQAYRDRDFVHISPHFESWMWACYLWLYDKTGYKPLLEKTKEAIRITMKAYPEDWLWGSSMQMQRARMILPLAWLVRVDDTPEHRQWLDQLVAEITKYQDECGAIREEIGGDKGRKFRALNRNSDYGLDEGSLIFRNGETASCLLYTCNFALFGLAEAAAATQDEKYIHAVNKLSDFMTRVQVRSSVHPDLDGAWFRGFDYTRWDYWASNSDIGWGTWCTLTGWIQSWIVATQIQLETGKSFWELTKTSTIAGDAEKAVENMLD